MWGKYSWGLRAIPCWTCCIEILTTGNWETCSTRCREAYRQRSRVWCSWPGLAGRGRNSVRSDDQRSGSASIRTATPTLAARVGRRVGAAMNELQSDVSCGGNCVGNMQFGGHHPLRYRTGKSTSTRTALARSKGEGERPDVGCGLQTTTTSTSALDRPASKPRTGLS